MRTIWAPHWRIGLLLLDKPIWWFRPRLWRDGGVWWLDMYIGRLMFEFWFRGDPSEHLDVIAEKLKLPWPLA